MLKIKIGYLTLSVLMGLAACVGVSAQQVGPPAEQSAPNQVSSASPSLTPGTQELTIDQAVLLALKNNSAVKIAEAEVRAARARVTGSRSYEYPEVSGSMQYEHLTKVPSFEIPALAPGVPAQPLTLTPKDNTVGAITARQAIYTGGRVSGNISRAEALYDAALSRLGVSRAETALRTRQAFYSVLLNRALVSSSRQNLDAAQKQLVDAQAKYDAGTAAQFDVLRAQTQVSNAEQILTQNLNRVQISMVALNRVMWTPLDGTFTLIEPGLASIPTNPLTSLVTDAENQRAEILAARAQLKAAEYGIRVAKAEAYPQVGVSASYQNIFNPNPSQVSGWVFAANISQEIFDAGRIRSGVREAKSMRDEAEIYLADSIAGVEQDVRQAYLNLQTGRQTLATAETSLAQAKDAHEVATVRYGAGVGTATELADAFAALAAARANVDIARFNYNVDFATLQRALGLITY
ncbi:MAG TPA: TolC family protein [Armatimonadota bacterium]|jgi:outer membrane protein TolC